MSASKNVCVSWDNTKETVFSKTPSNVSYVLERCDGLVCGVGCYLAIYFTATTYMSGQGPGRQLNTLHLQETLHRVKKNKTKKQEHQPILQQIDSTCVLCLRDTLQMTNKQNEPNNSRFGRHIAGRSWSLWKSTGLHREPGGEHDLLTLAVMVPDLRNYGPHNFNAVFIALQIWQLHVQLQQPESLYMATANCIQAEDSSGGLQNHFHCLF